MHVFYTYLSIHKHEDLLKEQLPEFPESYQQKIRRFKNWEDAQRSLAGRVMLHRAIQAIYKVEYPKTGMSYNAYGKPFFKQEALCFNISHSGDIIICVLNTEAEVGIDIERMLPLDPADFQGQMTASEWQHITTAADSLMAFYDYWTQKEAVIKAQGKGLSTPLTLFEIKNKTTILGGQTFYLEPLLIDAEYKCYIASTCQIAQYSLSKMIL